MVSKNRIENALDMYAFIASFPEIRVVLDFFCCLEYNVKREITAILRRLYHIMRIICRPADFREVDHNYRMSNVIAGVVRG